MTGSFFELDLAAKVLDSKDKILCIALFLVDGTIHAKDGLDLKPVMQTMEKREERSLSWVQ